MRAWRVAAPLLGLALAAALWPATRALSDLAREGSLGPGFWPRLALLGLALACLAKTVEEWRRARGWAWTPTPREPISRGRLAGSIALVLAYAALAPALGFAVTTAAFIVAFMALAGERSLAGLAVSAAVGTVSLVYVFVRVVYVPLPKGDGPFEAVTLALYRALGIF
jgi:putative tricarboxylic transport membrane protein